MEDERFIIGRFDHYYDSVNNKSNVLLAIGVFVATAVAASIAVCKQYLEDTTWTYVWLYAILFVNTVSIVLILKALIPYIDSKGDSLIYFGSIAAMSEKDFQTRFNGQTDSARKEDLTNQIYELAKGLTQKFKWLRIAGLLFLLEALLLLPLIITVTNNLK